MGDGNSFPFVVWLLLVILACKSIVLCKCSGNRIIGYGEDRGMKTMHGFKGNITIETKHNFEEIWAKRNKREEIRSI